MVIKLILNTICNTILLLTLSVIPSLSEDRADDSNTGETKDILAKAKEAYTKYCYACHGKYGKGDGHGANISGIPPRDLTNGAYMTLLSDDDIFKRIKYGENRFPYLQMPSFESSLTNSTINALVKYIRTIQEPGKLKGPTPKEREELFKDPGERGRIYYMRYCSPCHGVRGDGKGWAAKRSGGKPVAHNDPIVMSRFTRQQIYDHVRGLTKKRDRNMLVFGGTISPNMVRDISSYTKTLSVNLGGS